MRFHRQQNKQRAKKGTHAGNGDEVARAAHNGRVGGREAGHGRGAGGGLHSATSKENAMSTEGSRNRIRTDERRERAEVNAACNDSHD